ARRTRASACARRPPCPARRYRVSACRWRSARRWAAPGAACWPAPRHSAGTTPPAASSRAAATARRAGRCASRGPPPRASSPRSNVVDVTNYVTFELGQPSHAYDRRVLGTTAGAGSGAVAVGDAQGQASGANGPARPGVLQVRRARPGEQVTLLNEETIDLDPEDLVIATPGPDGESRAVGLAGVMGGLHDSVVADTTDVALEVATFEPVTVRRTARRHKLVTDA